MLVSMLTEHEHYNTQSAVHGCRDEVVVSHDGLRFIKTYANTNHEWWKCFADQGEEILVDAYEEVQKGVWLTLGGNFHSNIDSSTNLREINLFGNISVDGTPVNEVLTALNTECVNTYMVCDNVEQAVEYWKGAIEHPEHKYVIALMPVKKSAEPEEDGWRWHKWGKYIGTQNPMCEYLADEPNIELVYCAHIYNVEEI